MKLKIYTLLIAFCAAWSLHSCDNDDDESIAVPTALQEAFSTKYPNVKNREKNGCGRRFFECLLT